MYPTGIMRLMNKNIYKTGILAIFVLSVAVNAHAYLNGRIIDAYQTPFLYVYGTISPNPFENDVLRKTTQDVVDKWKILRGEVVPIKKDVDVTDEDIQKYNLLIYGNEHSNKILQRIAKDLPIRITDEAIIVGERKYTSWEEGAIFIAPNPLNPNKYVVVYGALSYHGFPHINAVKADFTDFVIFNSNTKAIQFTPPSPPLEEGFFDKTDPMHWKVTPLPKPPARVNVETSYEPITKSLMVPPAKKITLEKSRIFFDIGKTTLQPSDKKELSKIAKTLHDGGYPAILITGYIDSTGSPETNKKLALQRANAVKTYLASQKVPETAMTVRSTGNEKPVSPTKTQKQNRFVEIELVHPN
jgi:outer membrane protein OmpA-like peptidoglycan-associated protein